MIRLPTEAFPHCCPSHISGRESAIRGARAAAAVASDRSRWYSEDPIPIIYLIDRANDRRESDRPASRSGRWFLPGRWQCIARGSVGSPPLIGITWATANGGRHKAMRPGRGVAEWHMLPSWNSLHTLLVARAVLLWHGASYPMLRCSSLARHRILYGRTLPCAPYRTMPLILVSCPS